MSYILLIGKPFPVISDVGDNAVSELWWMWYKWNAVQLVSCSVTIEHGIRCCSWFEMTVSHCLSADDIQRHVIIHCVQAISTMAAVSWWSTQHSRTKLATAKFLPNSRFLEAGRLINFSTLILLFHPHSLLCIRELIFLLVLVSVQRWHFTKVLWIYGDECMLNNVAFFVYNMSVTLYW